MSPEDRAIAESIIRELERRKVRNKLDTFYATPENRKGYPVHMAFFEAGKTYRQRLALAANRVGKCIAGDTLIESPYGPARMVRDIQGPHWVWAWDGKQKVPALAEQPFVKKQERLYRVFFQDGQFLDCALEHRFLTESGWLFFESLAQCVPCLPVSTSALGPLTSLEDVQRCLRTLPSYRGDYLAELRSYDERLLLDQGNGLISLPLLGDALQRSLAWLRSGDLVDKCKRNLYELRDRLSSLCEVHHYVARCAEFEGQASYMRGQQYHGLRSAIEPLSIAEASELQSVRVGLPRSNESVSALISPDGGLSRVIAYQPLTIAGIYDFTVPEYANYCTLRTINHNTEGMGGYETVLHLTGRYPDWWKGRRFDKPVDWWIGGDTATTVRDINQQKLLGNIGSFGTGLIPGDLLIDTTNKRGVPDAVENIYVKHVSGGKSTAQMKSYDQGREAWQGTEKHGIWLDEEPPMIIYSEAVIRTMTTGGIVLNTYTPMNGMTDVTQAFLNPEKPDSMFVCTATWDDVLHLDHATKREMWNSLQPHERDARAKGIPTIGVGKIYPVNMEDLLVEPFDLPKYWPKGYALDVGWNKTAAIWGALDRDSDVLYLYSEHYQGLAEPVVHAAAIKARGDMQGFIDPASRGGSQADGEKLVQLYRNEGLNLQFADNAISAGIYDVFQRMTTGRLKIFRTLTNLQKELPIYHRDVNGNIVKKNDHLLDCMRYLVRAIPSLTYANTKTGHFDMTNSGVQYRTSRPTRRYSSHGH